MTERETCGKKNQGKWRGRIKERETCKNKTKKRREGEYNRGRLVENKKQRKRRARVKERENKTEGDLCTKIQGPRYSPILDTDTLDIMLKEKYNFTEIQRILLL